MLLGSSGVMKFFIVIWILHYSYMISVCFYRKNHVKIVMFFLVVNCNTFFTRCRSYILISMYLKRPIHTFICDFLESCHNFCATFWSNTFTSCYMIPVSSKCVNINWKTLKLCNLWLQITIFALCVAVLFFVFQSTKSI